MSTPKAKAGETHAKVWNLKKQGVENRQIALILGISTQAVHYHLKRAPAVARLRVANSA